MKSIYSGQQFGDAAVDCESVTFNAASGRADQIKRVAVEVAARR